VGVCDFDGGCIVCLDVCFEWLSIVGAVWVLYDVP